MDVIGHDDPFVEVVAFTVKVRQCVRNDFRYFGLMQDARTGPLVEPAVYALRKQRIEPLLFFSGVGRVVMRFPFFA